MARNYEKNFGRLNRLWLEKETGKKIKRPKLSSLKTAAEVSKWLPHLKSELEFFLQQIEVPCYTEKKISECQEHISRLEAEYKAFVRKLRRLDSSVTVAPWTPRPYERRKPKLAGLGTVPELHPIDETKNYSKISFLSTPVLLHDSLYQSLEQYSGTNQETDQESDSVHINNTSTSDNMYHLSEEGESSSNPRGNAGQNEFPFHHKCFEDAAMKCEEIPTISASKQIESLPREKNVLGLCYSSSDED